MTKNMLQKGFTLIELLVVIAIIGILAAVVIGSLNDARSGGQNASIQQSTANVRPQAELFYNGGGYTYTGMCGDTRITGLINAALDVVNGANYASSTTAADNSIATAAQRVGTCRSNDVSYIVQTPMADPAADDTEFWCVDSTGASQKNTSPVNTATDYTCN